MRSGYTERFCSRSCFADRLCGSIRATAAKLPIFGGTDAMLGQVHRAVAGRWSNVEQLRNCLLSLPKRREVPTISADEFACTVYPCSDCHGEKLPSVGLSKTTPTSLPSFDALRATPGHNTVVTTSLRNYCKGADRFAGLFRGGWVGGVRGGATPHQQLC